MKFFRASMISPASPTELKALPDALLAVAENGRIEALGPWEALWPHYNPLPVHDLRPHWILPGLLDLHTHLPQLDAVARDGLALLPWLETHIFPLESRFSLSKVAKTGAKRFFQSLLENGTTTACIYCTIHESATTSAFEEAEKCGIRAVIGKVLMDRNAPPDLVEDTDLALESAERLCEKWHGQGEGRLHFALTPRFAPSCTESLMLGASRIAHRHNAFIQSHIGENNQEIAWVRRLFPEAHSYADVYQRAGLLGPRTLLAHGIHLTSDERVMIRHAGSSIVHCPRSNAFLANGIMPLRQWLTEGLPVGLGTDVGAGPSLSLFAEMAFACSASKLRQAENNEKPLTPTEAFYLATLGGAKALGFERDLGSLEPGKQADFVVVDPVRCQPKGAAISLESAEQILSRLLYRECPGMVKATYVRGRLCFSKLKALGNS